MSQSSSRASSLPSSTGAVAGSAAGSVGGSTPPSWAVPPAQQAMWASDFNKKRVAEATGALDFVLYGDSITAVLATRKPALWKKYFGHVSSLALGVGGSTVENLAWRLWKGGEAPAVAPRAAAFLIGTNNRSSYDQAAARFDYLLQWFRRKYPSTKLVVVAILPENVKAGFAQKNPKWQRAAAKAGAAWVTCGQDLDPRNPSLFPDGLHPSDAAYELILPCLVSRAGL